MLPSPAGNIICKFVCDMHIRQLFWNWQVAGQHWGVWLAWSSLDSPWQQGWSGGQEGGGYCHLHLGDHVGAGGEGTRWGFGSRALHGFLGDQRPHWSQCCAGIFLPPHQQHLQQQFNLPWLCSTVQAFHSLAETILDRSVKEGDQKSFEQPILLSPTGMSSRRRQCCSK